MVLPFSKMGIDTDLDFGNIIYNSAVVWFIEKREYVDYVANFKLILHTLEKEDAGAAEDITKYVGAEYVTVSQPDSILVSADQHIIDPVTTESYDFLKFEGIGYMMINNDFIIEESEEI